MSRSPFKKHPILLLAVPVLIIYGGGWLLSLYQKHQERLQNTPPEYMSGPYRTQFVSEDTVPVSPFEVWQGFDNKILVRVRDLGTQGHPAFTRLNPMRDLRVKAYLVGKIKGQTRRIGIQTYGSDYNGDTEPSPPQGLRFLLPTPVERPEAPIQTATFLASTAAFDAGTEVRLQGQLFYVGHVNLLPGGPSGPKGPEIPKGFVRENASYILSAFTHPISIDQVLRKKGQANQLTADKKTLPIEKKEAILLPPRMAGTRMAGSSFMDYQYKGSSLVRIRFKGGITPDHSKNRDLQQTAAQLFDASGHKISVHNDYSELLENAQSPYGTVMVTHFPIENIPASRGQITLKMWVTQGGAWPSPIQLVIRPTWVTRQPKTLKLHSISTKSGVVTVALHYNGSKALEYKRVNQGKTHFFDTRLGESENLPTKKANFDRLITDWSQHLRFSDGKPDWSSRVESVSCDKNNNCRVVYRSYILNVLKPGQSAKFHADIGIEDDGFLPIDAVITRPKS